MWYLEKDVIISAAHHLEHYAGKCKQVHGHNWYITVYCRGYNLQSNGILVDFSLIKAEVSKLDHVDLNSVLLGVNPTAENIAKYICEHIPFCYKVAVEECEGSRCFYVKD